MLLNEKVLYLALITALNTRNMEHYGVVSEGVLINIESISDGMIRNMVHIIQDKVKRPENKYPKADDTYWMEICRKLNEEMIKRYKESKERSQS